MPRAPRIIGDYVFYHALNRGNSRRLVFFNEWDYRAFVDLLKESKVNYPIDILAYCLMPNHFHIVCMPRIGEEMSKWMHWIENAFVKRHHIYNQTDAQVPRSRIIDDEDLPSQTVQSIHRKDR